MFAVIAAIFFGVALLLDLVDTGGEFIGIFTLAGLLAIAIHLAVGGSAWPWRRTT
jgi:hypothetical protein